MHDQNQPKQAESDMSSFRNLYWGDAKTMPDAVFETNHLPEFTPPGARSRLVLEDGRFLRPRIRAETTGVGEVCFNTSMTGYQEIMTDPSYAGQLITYLPAYRQYRQPDDVETSPPCAGHDCA